MLAPVRALVSVDDADGVGTLRAGSDSVRELVDDPDPWDDVDVQTVEGALAASAWQIRQGAARALA